MSRNTDPTRGCAGKQKFRTFRRAEISAKRASKANEEPFHAYKCIPCNYFHVGHSKPALVKPAAPVDASIEDES